MKNNRDKLHSAFDELRGDTLREAAAALEAPVVQKRNTSRRWVGVTAACLSAVMVLGAVVTIPLLSADDPSLPDTNQMAVSVPSTDATLEAPEENYPFVRVQVLSATTDDNGDKEQEKEESVSVDMEYSRIMLTFNCAEGETAEITSHRTLNSKNAVSKRMETLLMQIESMEFSGNALKILERMLYREIRTLERNGEMETVLEPFRVMTQISDHSFLVHKNLFRPTFLSDVVDFVIRNENGEAVGAGSVCLAAKMLYSSNMVRYEILGSKRFDAPVSDEDAAAYIDGLHENAEAVIAGMDFSPVTAEEGYELAKIDIIKLCYGNGQVIVPVDSLWTNSASFWEFRILKIRGRAQDEERFFITFLDGTWGEISEDSGWIYEECTDEKCTFGEDEHEHHTGRTFLLTDGRTVSVERQVYFDENGQSLEKYVPVFAPDAESA